MTTPNEPGQDDLPEQARRQKPSRKWYLLSAVILLASAGVFVGAVITTKQAMRERVEQMPRFAGPTSDEGVLITIDEPGKYFVFYENLGTYQGTAYDTPRHQVWPDPLIPAMTCSVTESSSGESVAVRLPEAEAEADKTQVTEDLIIPYRYDDMEGHGVWVFEVDEPGEYRIAVGYVDEVTMEPGSIEVRPELTSEDRSQMLSVDGEAYDAARRDEVARNMITHLEPVDVLFAVGQDPTRGTYFNVFGLKGAATVLALGFTASSIITVLTFMLRSGHVTPRGEMSKVQRGLFTEQR